MHIQNIKKNKKNKIMRRNNDRMLLESLVRKYGKNGVKNAIRRINENVNGDFEIRNDVLVKYRGNGGKVVIPDSVTVIGQAAFMGCTSLTSVIIPDTVIVIGDWAFFECTSLTSVTIPASVKSIREAAFHSCASLTRVTIPNSVTEIGGYAFIDCTSLKSITIPDSVTSIGASAFRYCDSLASVTIGDGVASIESSAFEGCTALTHINIPDSVTEIEYQAFKDCTALANINIPKGVRVGKDAFKGTKNSNLARKYGKRNTAKSINIMAYDYNRLGDQPLTYFNQLDFKEYFIKRSTREGYEFNKNIFYFDDVDCVDMETSRDIPGVKANKTLNFDEAYNRLLKYFLNKL